MWSAVGYLHYTLVQIVGNSRLITLRYSPVIKLSGAYRSVISCWLPTLHTGTNRRQLTADHALILSTYHDEWSVSECGQMQADKLSPLVHTLLSFALYRHFQQYIQLRNRSSYGPWPFSDYLRTIDPQIIRRLAKDHKSYGSAATIFQLQLYIVAVSFIGGGNWSTRRKPPTCHKSLTNFIT